MLDGYRRGYEIASNELAKSPTLQVLPEKDYRSIAQRVFTEVKLHGRYAHLDPEADFVRGFVDRLRTTYIKVL